MTSWLGNACCRFMKLLTRMKNMMKMSRCIGDVRKKWYARNRKACVRYRLLIDRMTLAALMAAARFVGVRKAMTLERMGILGKVEDEILGVAVKYPERHGTADVRRIRVMESRLSISSSSSHSPCGIPSDAQLRLRDRLL